VSKLDKGRFDKARAELKADLELFHMLSAATPEAVPELASLTAIALEAVAKSAVEYQDAGAQLGFTPQGRARRERIAAAGGDSMSTEDLMRLVAEDSESK
jgi:hypothetical protein